MTPAITWAKALKKLEGAIGVVEVDSWLRDARLTHHEPPAKAHMTVPSRLHEERIRAKFLPHICVALEVQSCDLDVALVEEEFAQPDELPIPKARPPAADPASAPAREREPAGLVLNPDYVFDAYVVGPCNRFAHAAARGVADRPAVAFNPLFLHGPVGVGKTHLMQAIAHHLLAREADLKIVFLSCETFINHFIQALQQGQPETFRHRYRQADVLVVDDIQLLANKARTQEEFFHTFNTLHNAQKQIVLSSDSPPEEIPALQERLVSRFKWGLVAEIEPPCFETRVAILQAKAARSNLALPDDAAHYLAEHVQNNVRELEGTLTRMQALAALNNRQVDLDLAREVLAPTLRGRVKRPVRMDDILETVTSHFGVKVSDLQSKRRTQSVVLPRQVAMNLARKLTPLSLEEIGGFFGGRDHSTVLYSLEKMEQRRRVDAEFANRLAELEREVRRRVEES
ncbi:MAG TPA: chromosomal replication initiator protein DnaA [Planctomycetota bacterium]